MNDYMCQVHRQLHKIPTMEAKKQRQRDRKNPLEISSNRELIFLTLDD
ncbi:hypothetical protein WN51_02224 [Melipona quadrifasciata]|uniref:Uncharacterized protein n=1 Tax=Melipona quadrifasciata TaxID=166423 RepID=A0A0M8ZTG8_9HYME|nr:hypothetical protein WN51_02224 [Melipona quadrifasciata]